MAPMAARSGRSRRRFTWPVRLSPRRSTPRAPWWPRCDRAVLYCVPRPGAVQRAHHPLRDGRAALQLPLHRADACRGRLVRNRRREPGVPSITSPARLWKHAWAGAGYSRRPPCVCADPVARKSQRRFWTGTKDIQPRCFRGLDIMVPAQPNTGRRSNSIESTGSWNGALEVRSRSCPKGGVMRAGLFGAALSAALLAPFCAQAQDGGVFDKWLDQKAPVCVPVPDLKAVSRVTDLTPAQFQFVRALDVALPPVSRTLPPGDRAIMATAGEDVMLGLVDND